MPKKEGNQVRGPNRFREVGTESKNFGTGPTQLDRDRVHKIGLGTRFRSALILPTWPHLVSIFLYHLGPARLNIRPTATAFN